ncbi:CPXCG motif-containing cysteine-rich protein [Halopseudomonas maritima]|uniref:CPXCG motif-containing cysteine-rich protein n=1 Tax=Halopseudomonas maritima TaxID=2918528 RepID=UPI001EEA3513|nr:CPXCG motif-containing cysteine-rich protein [Halopseudomonas maritima]
MQALEEANLACPHCGEPITLLLDLTGGAQSYVEDCQVCCQPILVNLWIDEHSDEVHIDLRREQD